MPRLVSLLWLQLGLLALLSAPAAQAATLFDAGSGTDAVVVQMSRLPTWVQVTNPTAPLFSSDTPGGAVSTRLAGFTFLRVLGGGTSRLQVDVFDENGKQSARGWVDPNDVLPSAPGTDWLVSATPTSLWKDAADGAPKLRNVDRFAPLQQVDGPVQDRIEVRVYRPDFTILDQGWVDVADTGPAFPPQVRVQSPTTGTGAIRNLAGTNQQQAFLDATGGPARTAARLTGVPASVTVAQAILESDWGRSQLAQSANNFFGIKATSSLGNDGLVWLPTSEYDADGQTYETMSPFRAYKSLVDSMTDHDKLLLSTRYAPAMQVANDPRQFAEQLYQAGYSTDPAYADKLIALMDRYNLYSLDG